MYIIVFKRRISVRIIFDAINVVQCSQNRLVGFTTDSGSNGYSWGGGEVSNWRAFAMVKSQADERCVCPPTPLGHIAQLSEEDVRFIKCKYTIEYY